MNLLKEEKIQLREMINEKPWAIRTVSILERNSENVILWMPEGSSFVISEGYLKNPNFNNERWDISNSGRWEMIDTTWKHNHVLIHKELDAYYSVQLFWSAKDDKFLGYYVNFELPYTNTITGFDTLDLDLDIMVYPDFRLEMKDVEEYQRAVLTGDINDTWAKNIDLALHAVKKKITSREFPFDGSLIALKPN